MPHSTETLIRFTTVKIILAILSLAFFVVAATMNTTTTTVPSQALPGCDEWCGNVQIKYPFGTREGCYLNETFLITCNTTDTNSPKAFLRGSASNIIVTNISIISGELQILNLVAQDCHPPTTGPDVFDSASLNIPPYIISKTKNKLIGIGCDTFVQVSGVNLQEQFFRTGCVALCDDITSVKDGACSGNGCCQLEIPSDVNRLAIVASSLNNHVNVSSFNPCGYAFLVEQNSFNFSSKFISNFTENRVLAVLDWAISNTSCETGGGEKKSNCVCGPNSSKVDLAGDPSQYRCQCLEGYEGNPYLPQGCQDIDECKNESLNECRFECVNTIGNYTCNCPNNFKGDGRNGGDGCTRQTSSFIQIIVGVTAGFAVLVIGATCLYLGYRKWRFLKLKEKFFEQNGGLMLQQHLSQWQTSTDMVRIFTKEELDKATNKYDESAVVGKGGYGTVYKGVLDDGSVVAIKKSKLVDQSQTSQFINEVIVLSQINHRNVVKLLGCCLETQVPLLVYEFITNGTLYEYVHEKNNERHSLPWEDRLRIASETAGVISYLHSSASTPIIHRDIKTTNILLDHNYTAKVSDFGASKLVPVDQTQLSTMVQGTLGYLDPEYLLTSELTEKSDVYSFGIVLLELITGKKAVTFEGPEAERNLAMYVLCAMKEDRLAEVVEKGMATEGNFGQIKEAVKLATRCLRIRGEERPSMKEVAMELESLKGSNEKLETGEETMVGYLVQSNGSSESTYSQFVGSGSTNIADDSLKVHILPLIHKGR